MTCIGKAPAGLQKNCGSNFEKVKNVYFLEAGTAFASKQEASSFVKWQSLIREDLKIWGGKIINSYEVTTPDATEITLDSGKKLQTDRPNPSMSMMLNVNVCDANMIFNSADGKGYDIVMELNNGTIIVEKFRGGTRQGMNATVYAKTKGIHQPADVGNNVKVDIYFESYDAFLKLDYITPVGWNLSSLILAASPLGLNMTEEVDYTTASSDVGVQIDIRCDGGYEGLLVGDFVVTGSNQLDTPAVTAAVDNGNGSYTLTLEKGATPAALAVGDYMTIQVQKKSGSIVEYISEEVTIIALV
jgi:hypothetical protein